MSITSPPAPKTGRRSSRTLTGAFLCFLVLASVQIWLPLSTDPVLPALLTVVALSLTTCFAAASTWGYLRVSYAAMAIIGLSLLVEAIGVRTGFPFGSYVYATNLGPAVLGVPLIVPLAWFAMGLPAWEVARRIAVSDKVRCLLGAGALTAWDVFLDPQMTVAGFWNWPGGGAWRGVPLQNYAGWFVCALLLMAVLARLLRGVPDNAPLALLYAWMAVMCTAGFLLPFVFDDPLVGVVGGSLMLSLTALALFRTPISKQAPWRGSS